MREFDDSDVPEVPEELVSAVINNTCVLFAGAGISRSARLPAWNDFLMRLVVMANECKAITDPELEVFIKNIKENKQTLVAETLKIKLSSEKYYSYINSIFNNPTLKITKRHQLIMDIPFSAILTTNYDLLLEEAYKNKNKRQIRSLYYNQPDNVVDALYNKTFFILKVHGDVLGPQDIILSESDYRNIKYRQPGFDAAIKNIFLSKTVFFVGASLRDPDIKLILESLRESFSNKGTSRKLQPHHFALYPEKDADPHEIEIWDRLFDLKIIPYKGTKGHPQIDAFLEKLKEKVYEEQPNKNTSQK